MPWSLPQSTPPTPILVTAGLLALPSTQGAPHHPGGPRTPGPHGPLIGSARIPSRVPTHSHISARDDCQQLAGPKTQLPSLSRGRGSGCSSSQGGHSSCNSFQALRQPWAAQAGMRVRVEAGEADPRPRNQSRSERLRSGPKSQTPTEGGKQHGPPNRPAPSQLEGWWGTSSGPPEETATGEPERRRRTGYRRERFPPSAERGSSTAARESGHHGCLYYPPSNSNFFPSLLANYPASVLISFYYWN